MNAQLDFSVESLEQRLNMAGNVSVEYQSDGDLILHGDSADNYVSIVADTVFPGATLVRGEAGTLVNGVPELRVFGSLTDIEIYMRSGNNTVWIQDMFVNDEIIVRTGSGDDNIAIVSSFVLGDISISTSGGDDSIGIEGNANFATMRAYEDVFIKSGSGNDFIMLTGMYAQEDVSINTSSGDDVVALERSRFDEDVQVTTGSGFDWVSASNVIVRESLSIKTSSGDDLLFITGTEINQDKLSINLGSGNDRGIITFSWFETLDVNAASGDDVLVLTGMYAQDANIRMSGGDDQLLYEQVTVGSGTFSGGGGSDDFYHGVGNFGMTASSLERSLSTNDAFQVAAFTVTQIRSEFIFRAPMPAGMAAQVFDTRIAMLNPTHPPV